MQQTKTLIFIFSDPDYLEFLRGLYEKWGIGELYFTGDGGKELKDGTLPNVFAAVNFQKDVMKNIGLLRALRPSTNIFHFSMFENNSIQ